MKAVVQAIARRIKLYNPPYANTKMGQINETEFRVEAELSGFKVSDLSNFYTNDLIEEINRFDPGQIVADAKAYKI